MKNKAGFTLAEMLVTVLSIGIVAALTIPVINNNRPNQEQVMLKKAYMLLGRALVELIQDESLYPDFDDTGFSDNSTQLCQNVASRMNTITESCGTNKSFVTTDGIRWTIPDANFGNGGDENHRITVDVSGDNNGQNCTENENNCTAPDRFTILMSKEGKLSVPQDSIAKVYLDRTRTNKTYSQIKKECPVQTPSENEPEQPQDGDETGDSNS